jgi:hypothetical protein
MFDSAVVAIDMPVGTKGLMQRTYLPLLNSGNASISANAMDARDAGDGLSRCRAKAVAMTLGTGLSLYAGFKGSGTKLFTDLHLEESSDLGVTAPLTTSRKVGGRATVQYLEWSVALAAAKITDPEFVWEIENFAPIDAPVPQLYAAAGKGYLVGVRVNYKGHSHLELLPIMDSSFNAMVKPTAADWNKTVMRALAKAVAVASGYGLSLYIKEVKPDTPAAKQERAKQQQEQASLMPVRPKYAELGPDAEALPDEDKALLSKALRQLKQTPTVDKFAAALTFVQNAKLTDASKAFAQKAIAAMAAKAGLSLPASVAAEPQVQVAQTETQSPAQEQTEAKAPVQVKPEEAKVNETATSSTRTLAESILKSLKKDLSTKRVADAMTYIEQSVSKKLLTVEDQAYLMQQIQALTAQLAAA